jgi:hypothetical protein
VLSDRLLIAEIVMLFHQAVEQWLPAGAPYLLEHQRLGSAQPGFDRRGVNQDRLWPGSVCQRIMPDVTHRRQADLASSLQHQKQATAHHVAEGAIRLAPLPSFTKPDG